MATAGCRKSATDCFYEVGNIVKRPLVCRDGAQNTKFLALQGMATPFNVFLRTPVSLKTLCILSALQTKSPLTPSLTRQFQLSCIITEIKGTSYFFSKEPSSFSDRQEMV